MHEARKKSEPPRSDRERVLEWQVRFLADRLAIALTEMTDAELEAFCDGDAEGLKYWEEMQEVLIDSDNEGWDFRRKALRKSPLYSQSMQRIKDTLSSKIRAIRLRQKHAA